jgi:DNA-binding transcriptional regulator YhcF (GntR family)
LSRVLADAQTGPARSGEITNAIPAAVGDGSLLPGDRLATHRFVAQHLNVDLATVTRGYGEAHRQGLVVATVDRDACILNPAVGWLYDRWSAAIDNPQ